MIKKVVFFCVILVLMINFISADDNCTQNWNCTAWSICINEAQTRDCTDLNNCNNDSNKPIIVESCVCLSDWQCTDWSECLEEIQIRSCIDFNTCRDNSTKPVENQSCIMCIPNWECSEWEPEICSRNEMQTKTCTDTNNCGTIRGKPAETKSCESKFFFNWLTLLIALIIILMIIVDIILIIKQWKKLNKSITPKTNLKKPFPNK